MLEVLRAISVLKEVHKKTQTKNDGDFSLTSILIACYRYWIDSQH